MELWEAELEVERFIQKHEEDKKYEQIIDELNRKFGIEKAYYKAFNKFDLKTARELLLNNRWLQEKINNNLRLKMRKAEEEIIDICNKEKDRKIKVEKMYYDTYDSILNAELAWNIRKKVIEDNQWLMDKLVVKAKVKFKNMTL